MSKHVVSCSILLSSMFFVYSRPPGTDHAWCPRSQVSGPCIAAQAALPALWLRPVRFVSVIRLSRSGPFTRPASSAAGGRPRRTVAMATVSAYQAVLKCSTSRTCLVKKYSPTCSCGMSNSLQISSISSCLNDNLLFNFNEILRSETLIRLAKLACVPHISVIRPSSFR